jgi:hypothetical protein
VLSNLISKARNLHVCLWLRSGTKLAVKIIDFDDVFVEVIVKVNPQTGAFATTREQFETAGDNWREDRILVSINDISMVA